MVIGHPGLPRRGQEVAGSGGFPSLLNQVSELQAGAWVAFPAVGVAGVATPAVTVRVVPVSQAQEQALQVRMAGKLVHERSELLVRGVLSCGWRHRCTSVHEQEGLPSSLCDVPG